MFFSDNFRKSVLVFLFSLCFSGLLSAAADKSVTEYPRHIYVTKTEHFEILFPDSCVNTAKILADNAEAVYFQAKELAQADVELHLPVVIAPDSDVLSVKYTQLPYNRILIYDGVPQIEDAVFDDIILGLFFKEVFAAFSITLAAPGISQKISKVAGKVYTPISWENIPFTFIEGRSIFSQSGLDIAGKKDDSCGYFNDGYYLQLLVQAKMENKVPSVFQASADYDIYPGNDLMYAVWSAFSAYLITTYGIEKFYEFWQSCGNLSLYFLPGYFYKNYRKSINSVWKDFIASIPAPENYERMNKLDKESTVLSGKDKDGLFESFIITPYGTVWYDGRKQKVMIYDSSADVKKQTLFVANDIQRMTLSPTGDEISVSYLKINNRKDFVKQETKIYSLKKRRFVSTAYRIGEAAIIKDENGNNLLAGFYLENNIPKLQVFSYNSKKSHEPVYEKSFERTVVPSSIVYGEPGVFSYLLSKNNRHYLCRFNLKNETEDLYAIKDKENHQINLRKLSYINTKNITSGICSPYDHIYTFQYVPENGPCLTRMGFIGFDKDSRLIDVQLLRDDLTGGVYYPVFYDDKLYYCSKNLSYNQIKSIPYSILKFERAGFEKKPETVLPSSQKMEITIADMDAKNFNPFNYLFHIGVKPLLIVRDLSVSSGASYWPGLGATFTSNSGPYTDTQIIFSLAWSYLKYDFSKAINATTLYQQRKQKEKLFYAKDKSAVLMIQNSSTPVNLLAGSLFRFNLDGQYDFEFVYGANWSRTFGLGFSTLNFDLQSNYSISTDYYNSDFSLEYLPSLKNWPAFDKAYRLSEACTTVTYSNIRQYGISPYEKAGFSLGTKFYYSNDISGYEFTSKVLDSVAGYASQNSEFKERLDAARKDIVLSYTQFTIGVFADINLPEILPVKKYKGWIFSLPATSHLELFTTNSTAFQADSKILLAGWEIHNGISPLLLYVSRIGLFAGYDFRLDYDSATSLDELRYMGFPDIRAPDRVNKILQESYVNDCIYAVFNMDFGAPVGVLSSKHIKLDFKYSYFIRTNLMEFKVNFTASF